MASFTIPAVLMLTLASVSFGAELSAGEVAVNRSGSSDGLVVRLFDVAAVRRAFDALARQREGMTEGERVAAWTDFSQLAEAVIGNSPVGPFTFDDLIGAAGGAPGPQVIATRGVAARSRVAYQMQAVGYSARETADVVGRRISRRALDTAQRMIAVGYGRDKAAAYLDSQYARVAALRNRHRVQLRPGRSAPPGQYDAIIQRYANAHEVEVAIVRAIIEAESAFNPAARSRAGAIGLMQLMPMTARELQVDPFVPDQNIEGGVRYFSQLLERFGGLELALVAYNAGPGFAERYVRGQAVLYGETRQYVKNVLASLSNQH
jgi:soluble lytic murein transglycosylase-like protein